MPGANQQPRILTPEEVEVILESVDGVDSLVATLRFHERRAIQTRQLADDYKRLVESAHEDTDAARRWSRVWKASYRRYRDGYQHLHGEKHFIELSLADEREWRQRAEAEVAQLRERIADAENVMSADTMAYAKLSAESNGYREQAEATGKLIVESYGYQRNFEERWHAAKAEVAALRASRDQLQEALANAHVQVERYKAVATAAREAVADGWWDYAEDGTCIALSAALAALEEAKP